MKTKKRRSGTSLIEVVVVLAIMVVVAALAIPSIQSMHGSYKLNGAVDSVRSAWADARARAIEEGRPYRFAVEPEGSSFRVAPDHPDYWDGSNGVPENDPNGVGLVLEKSLPGGVRFTVNGEGAVDLPDEPGSDSLEEKPVTTANWSPAVIFLPDGTAREDVKVEFRVRGCKPTSLQLRGLTGNVSVQAEH
jgi:type II secretory pathway pseudopilin PulG